MIQVLKRNGKKEPLDLEKFHKVVRFACEGLAGVSASEVELKSQIQFANGIKTSDIQEILIQAAAQLITEDTPNYQYVAGRLINYDLRKHVYGQYEPPSLLEHYQKIVKLDYYAPDLDFIYSDEDWEFFESVIDHNRDDLLTYAAMEQFRGKYLIRNRDTSEFYETPQVAFMLIAMTLFQNEGQGRLRRRLVKDFYDALSTFDISLPSPIMAGVRSPDKQFSSCVLIESGDSLNSINATSNAIVKYVSRRAGIGIGGGAIRAAESAVRGGKVRHTGVRPFYRMWSASVDSCSQGSLRKGSATLNYVGWHREFEDILVLKNNRGTEDSRIRGLDYCIQLNRVFYERLLSGGVISFFSPSDVPGLYEAFFADVDLFRELYEKAERNTRIPKKQMPAQQFFEMVLQERKDTGRLYISNVDHVNSHGSFLPEVAPVRMTNLCVEITLPTQPLESVDLPELPGEIALCTLSALNFGKANSPDWFKKPAALLVRALNNLLDYQDYPIEHARRGTLARRSLGIGVTNFAYWIAKNGMTYSKPDYAKIHQYAEGMAYWLTKASIELAKSRGACAAVNETKYGQGILPIDTYKKDVDLITSPDYYYDWEELRDELEEFGILNSTLMAGMPCETSSATTNSTNGFEPISSLVTTKISKDLNVKQVVPEVRRLKNQYELKWDMKSNEGYHNILHIFQKFFDQAISVNDYYNPQHFPGEEIPMSVMIEDLVNFYRFGGKNKYYCNTFDGAGEIATEDDCESCKV